MNSSKESPKTGQLSVAAGNWLPAVRRQGAIAISGKAVGTLALGALALGAVAVAKLATGQIAFSRARPLSRARLARPQADPPRLLQVAVWQVWVEVVRHE
jgi:hypothetical protein